MDAELLQNKYRIFKCKYCWLNAFFIILPLVDSLNGFSSGIPVGKAYKLSLGILVLLNILMHRKKIKRVFFFTVLLSLMYISASIVTNILMGGRLGNIEFPIKLVFNLLLAVFLIQSLESGVMCGRDIFRILDLSTWVYIVCYLVPFFLGLGRRVYGGEMGYKAFFIAQNELSLIVAVLAFFTAFKLIYKFCIADLVKLACLLLCGMLLNTKAAILTCLIAAAFWLLPIILKGGVKLKIATIAAVIMGALLLRNKIIAAISMAIARYQALTTKYYKGSVFAGFLSGRNYYIDAAWKNALSHHSIVHFLFGNGFCSDVLIEMDFLDVFFYLGITGVLGIAFMLLWAFRKTLKNTKNDIGKIRVVSFVVLMGLAFFAGHVLFMSMSGCFFVLYICFLLYYPDRKLKGFLLNESFRCCIDL